MKKFFSLVLALVMALSLTTAAWGVDVADGPALQAAVADGVTITLPAGDFEVGTFLDLAAVPNDGTITIEGNANGTTVNPSTVWGQKVGFMIRNANGITLKFKDITFAGAGRGIEFDLGATSDVSLVVENCVFNNASSGAYLGVTVSDATFVDCVFDGCAAGVGTDAVGDLIVDDCVFEDTCGEAIGWTGTGDLSVENSTVDSAIIVYDPAANTDDVSFAGTTFTVAPDSALIPSDMSFVGGEVVKNTGTTYENLNGKYSNGTLISDNLDLLLNVIPAKAPTYDDDGVLVAPGKVESAIIKKGNAQVAGTGVYVLVNSLSELTDPADIVLYTDAACKYPAFYLKAVNTPEYAVGVVFTNFGKLCGQVNYPGYKATDVYFTAQGEDTGAIFVADKDGVINVMYGGKLVAVEPIGYSSKANAVPHKAMMINKNGKTTSIECTVCGLDAVQVANKLALPTGATQIAGTLSGVWYWPSATVVTPSTDKVTSAETFDAGIAMYVGMSVMAAAGSAVVIGKKKD